MPVPDVDQHPPAVSRLHWFGIVQYIDRDRMDTWCEFYRELFGFIELPDSQRFGIMPNGKILASPCKSFYLQLVEPVPDLVDVECTEMLQRIGLGTPSVRRPWRRCARGVSNSSKAARCTATSTAR